MTKQEYITCAICGGIIKDIESHNAEPVCSGRCCTKCNSERVLPERLAAMLGKKEEESNIKVSFTDGTEPLAVIACAVHKDGSSSNTIRGNAVYVGALLTDLLEKFMSDIPNGNVYLAAAIETALERKEKKDHV